MLADYPEVGQYHVNILQYKVDISLLTTQISDIISCCIIKMY